MNTSSPSPTWGKWWEWGKAGLKEVPVMQTDSGENLCAFFR
jgi:hypothetical protein